MAAKVVDEPVCVDAVGVESAVEVELIAVVVTVGVMGVSTPLVMYPIVETRPRVKMPADLLPQHPLDPQQNVPPEVEHSNTAGPSELPQYVGQDDAVPFIESLLVILRNRALGDHVRTYNSYPSMYPPKKSHSATRITR